MLPKLISPGEAGNTSPTDVQIRYTSQHGALLRADGRTRPISLDEVEFLFGEYVLNHMMERYGRWVDITTPTGAAVVATVNGRVYCVRCLPASAGVADYIV